MHQSKWLILFAVFVVLLVSGCTEKTVPTVVETATIQPTLTEIVPTNTPVVESSATPEPTQTLTPTLAVDYDTIACYSEDLPYAYAESSAVVGWKYFAEREGISYRAIFFPAMCSLDAIEQDLEYLLYNNQDTDETIFIMLEETHSGTLGQFYTHLTKYDFWAMGPEDYPMILDQDKFVNPNLIFFRVDRMNGEGFEGNEILGIMVGMGEHEYIHTVQTRNHPDLAFEIWNDPIYQACVEFYANLNNNSGQRYYRAPSAYLSLIQMLDGLLQMGDLEDAVLEALEEQDLTLDEFMGQEIYIYNSNINDLMVNMAGNNYLEYLQREELNALLLATRAGLGDLAAYTLIRTIYDQHIDDYNLWYYGSDDTNYLPDTFDELFRPY